MIKDNNISLVIRMNEKIKKEDFKVRAIQYFEKCRNQNLTQIIVFQKIKISSQQKFKDYRTLQEDFRKFNFK